MKKKVEKVIPSLIKKAKYSALSFDSTRDLSLINQPTFIVRYIQEDDISIERFLKFIEMHYLGAEGFTKLILEIIDELGSNIQDCRDQSYNDAAIMSGVYAGLQSRIKPLIRSPILYFVPLILPILLALQLWVVV